MWWFSAEELAKSHKLPLLVFLAFLAFPTFFVIRPRSWGCLSSGKLKPTFSPVAVIE